MATQIEIANWALTLIGEKRLSSLSDDNTNAELISAGWDQIRDTLILQAAWHCHIERSSIATSTDTPEWGFDYMYLIPGNVVRVLSVGESYPGLDLTDNRQSDTALYRIEAGYIVTNLGAPLYIKSLVNDKAVGTWHLGFARLMAADLAEFLNPRVTEDETKGQRLERWRYQSWAIATSTNAIEDPPENPADDAWMAAHAL